MPSMASRSTKLLDLILSRTGSSKNLLLGWLSLSVLYLISHLFSVHSNRYGNQRMYFRYQKLTLLNLLKAIFVPFHCYLRLPRCVSPSFDAGFLTSFFLQSFSTSLELFGVDLLAGFNATPVVLYPRCRWIH